MTLPLRRRPTSTDLNVIGNVHKSSLGGWKLLEKAFSPSGASGLETRVSPEDSVALEEALQAQQTLLPLRPVGAGAVVQDLRHVLRLPQVVRDAAVPRAVRAFRAGAGRVAVGVVVGVHARGLEPPPQRLPLPEDTHSNLKLRESKSSHEGRIPCTSGGHAAFCRGVNRPEATVGNRFQAAENSSTRNAKQQATRQTSVLHTLLHESASRTHHSQKNNNNYTLDACTSDATGTNIRCLNKERERGGGGARMIGAC